MRCLRAHWRVSSFMPPPLLCLRKLVSVSRSRISPVRCLRIPKMNLSLPPFFYLSNRRYQILRLIERPDHFHARFEEPSSELIPLPAFSQVSHYVKRLRI